MEFKGTKNEWYIGEHRQYGIQIGCSQSHYVACAYRGGADRNDDETIANAQLIATAPELLNMLQRLLKESSKVLSYFEAHDEIVSDLDNLLCESIDIISKALGKESDDE